MKFDQITDLLKDRILILDGAMGTMIQDHNLTEDDYRGKRFHRRRLSRQTFRQF